MTLARRDGTTFAWRTGCVFFAALLFVGCSNLQKQKTKHFERGQAYLAQGKTDAAILELKNVVQIDPYDVRGRYQLALAYLRRDDPRSLTEAHNHLSLAAQGDPNNLDVRLKLVEVCLREGNSAQATEHSQAAVRLAPNNPRALLLRGRCQLANGRTDDAMTDLRKAAALDVKAAEPLVYLARAWLVKEDLAQAKERLDRALALEPRSSTVQSALGDYYALRSEDDSAERAYHRAMELAPDDESAFLRFAEYLRRKGRWEAAEAAHQQRVAARPNDPKAHLALGGFYAERGQRDRALKHLQKSLELDPDSALALDRLLEVKLDSGNIEGVRADIKRLLERRADHPIAKYYQARIELKEKRYDEGIRLLRDLIQRHPEVGAAHLTLGNALSASGDRQGAKRALGEATKVESAAAEAHLALARLYLAEGSPQLAVPEARRAHERNPGHVPTVVAYADSLAKTGQLSTAVRVLAAAAQEHPKEPSLPHGLGLLARAQGEAPRALEQFEQALKIDPRYEPALREITAVYLAQKKHKQARERIEQQLQLVPDGLEYRILRGQVLEAAGQIKEAEAAYTQTMNSVELASDVYGRLATLYLKNKQVDAAIGRYRETLAKNPKQLGPHVIVGILSHVKGDVTEARQQYEAALKLNPREAIAANNLANLLADDGKELDRALKLGEAAYRERPGDENVIDTLGWIYYQKKNYPQAASLLSTAYHSRPANPVIAYHYGMTLSELKDRKAEAKQVLEGLLKLNPRVPNADRIAATLGKL